MTVERRAGDRGDEVVVQPRRRLEQLDHRGVRVGRLDVLDELLQRRRRRRTGPGGPSSASTVNLKSFAPSGLPSFQCAFGSNLKVSSVWSSLYLYSGGQPRRQLAGGEAEVEHGSVASSTPAHRGEPFGIIPLKLSKTVYSTWPTITDWSRGTGMFALPIWIDLVAAGLLPAGLSEYEPPPPEQAARKVASAAAPPPITVRRLS